MTRNETLKQEMRDVLENNILRFWIDRMQDDEHGGFYGRIDNQNVLHADAEKGAILNARILWTFSAAYRVLVSLNIWKWPIAPSNISSTILSTPNMASGIGAVIAMVHSTVLMIRQAFGSALTIMVVCA